MIRPVRVGSTRKRTSCRVTNVTADSSRTLYSVNRLFFNIFLDLRYGDVFIGVLPDRVVEETVASELAVARASRRSLKTSSMWRTLWRRELGPMDTSKTEEEEDTMKAEWGGQGCEGGWGGFGKVWFL